MSGGGGSTTTQKADPWSGIQPSLASLYGNLNSAYNAGQLAPNQNTGTVAGMPPELDALYRQIYNTGQNGTQGDQTLNGAVGQTQALAGGNFSGLQGANTLQGFANGNYAIDPVTGQMQQVAMGNTAGSGAYNNLSNFANGQFGGTIQGDALTQQANGDFRSPGGADLTGLANGNFSQGAYGLLNQSANGVFTGANGLLNQVANGNFNGAGLQQLQNTANGAYTNPNNAAVTALYNAQAQPLTQQFQQSTLPGLLSAYSAAGRYGSGANDTAINSASSALGQTLSNLSQSTIGTNYANERANQQSAAGQLAGYQTGAMGTLSGVQNNAASQLAGLQSGASGTLLNAQQGAANSLLGAQTSSASNLAGIQSQLSQYLASLRQSSAGTLAGIQGSAISALPGMGAQQNTNTWNDLSNSQAAMQAFQTQQQNVQNAAAAQYNYNQNQPLMGLNNLSGLLQNGMSLNGQSSQTTGGASTLAKVGTGALSGAATGAAVGSVVPGIGTAIGAGVGAIGGGLLGVL